MKGGSEAVFDDCLELVVCCVCGQPMWDGDLGTIDIGRVGIEIQNIRLKTILCRNLLIGTFFEWVYEFVQSKKQQHKLPTTDNINRKIF